MKYNGIIILGPTASGKTSISIELAKKLNGEIVNADSQQIYKDLCIGSARPSKEEMDGIKHHLIGFVKNSENYNVGLYKKDAIKIISKLIKEEKFAIVTGGTGLYIQSLLTNYDYGNIEKSEQIRTKYENMALKFGNEYVYNLLKAVDLKSANEIKSNDLKKVIRALEIFELTGKSKSEHSTAQNLEELLYTSQIKGFNPLIIGLDWKREEIYNRINKRVDIMFRKGLLEEVKLLKAKGLSLKNQCMNAIGYKELLSFLNGECSLEDAIGCIKQGTRNYAKRQLTWFNKTPNVKWIKMNEKQSIEIIIKNILKLLN